MSVNSLAILPLEEGDPTWAELTVTGDGRTAFHCPELVRLVAQAHGHRTVGWKVIDDRDVVGGLFVSRSEKGQVSPLPGNVVNGPVVRPSRSRLQSARDRHSSRVLAALLGQVGNERGATLRLNTEVGDIREALGAGWTAWPTFTYEMDLRDIDTAWAAMDGDRRRLVRRAESLGYVVDSFDPSRDDPDSVIGDLIGLNVEQKSRYENAAPPDADIWRTVIGGMLREGSGRLYCARASDGALVGFQFVVVWGDRAANLFTGSSPWHADRGSNSLLRWKVASALGAEGVDRLDLNGARVGSAGRFKASLGSTLTERWELYRPDRRLSSVLTRATGRARREWRAVRSGGTTRRRV